MYHQRTAHHVLLNQNGNKSIQPQKIVTTSSKRHKNNTKKYALISTFDIKTLCFMMIILGYMIINIYLLYHIQDFKFLRERRFHYYGHSHRKEEEQRHDYDVKEQQQQQQQQQDVLKIATNPIIVDVVQRKMEFTETKSKKMIQTKKNNEIRNRQRHHNKFFDRYDRLNFTTNESLRYRFEQQMKRRYEITNNITSFDPFEVYLQYVQSLQTPVNYIPSSLSSAINKTPKIDSKTEINMRLLEDNNNINKDNEHGNSNDNMIELVPYDILDCPKIPPSNYPYTWNAINIILRNWNPDNITIPNIVYHSLCIFNWNNKTQRQYIFIYQKYEVPFILQNYPEILATSYRWNHKHYMDELLLNVTKQKNEHSFSNHFMYWRERNNNNNKRKNIRNKMINLFSNQQQQVEEDPYIPPPVDNVEMTYQQWKEKAIQFEKDENEVRMTLVNDTNNNNTQRERWYFRLNGIYPTTNNICSDEQYRSSCNSFLYDELPFFSPLYRMQEDEALHRNTKEEQEDDDHDQHNIHVDNNNNITSNKNDDDNDLEYPNNLFMIDPEQERGLNCRFGMKGIIAEAHFDPTRNWIIMLKGKRRYIIAHPKQCQNLELYPVDHPSGRHSSVDWSNITQLNNIIEKEQKQLLNHNNDKDNIGSFYYAQITEVVLQPGDALYLPTSWFHYIVSLTNMNYQCNARSGVTKENHHYFRECGFPIPE